MPAHTADIRLKTRQTNTRGAKSHPALSSLQLAQLVGGVLQFHLDDHSQLML